MHCYLYKKLSSQFFGAGVLEVQVWEAGPNFKGRPIGAFKTDQPMPLPAKNLGTLEILLHES
jgi:hypothetical protein